MHDVRKKSYLFSAPLISTHKAAMTQCKNLHNYKTYSDIDDIKSILIENIGGTNESFALSSIKNAKLLIIKDNLKAIDSLTNGIDGILPNIMVSDSLEVSYQHTINPNLCEIPINIDNKISHNTFMFNKSKSGQKLLNNFING